MKQAGVSAALPGLHAFTGCDFTASFYRKGKIKPYELLENNNDGTLIQFFSSMSSREELNRKKAEGYVCSLYGMQDIKDVNEARYKKLVQMTGKISQVRVHTRYVVRKISEYNSSPAQLLLFLRK
jgi:hypothetical protein